MSHAVDVKVAVIVPNWNGMDSLAACVDSILEQTQPHRLIVVENGSIDDSLSFLRASYADIDIVVNKTNLGFAGGVNSGIRKAIADGYEMVALLNNDAIADPLWLEHLVKSLQTHQDAGIVTSKIVHGDKTHLDSTGDYYTVWGLPYPRGRNEHDLNAYDAETEVFGASGGASLYRVSMLEDIGLFDEDFFAYYEDVDISFRAQLAGWNVRFVPKAIAYHQIGATSGKLKGFTTYQTMKNLPLLVFKNVPRRYLWRIGWRFFLAHSLFFGRAVSRGQGWTALKGDAKGTLLLFTGVAKRRHIQRNKVVSDEYIWSTLVHDLPPNAKALRSLRARWWRVSRKQVS